MQLRSRTIKLPSSTMEDGDPMQKEALLPKMIAKEKPMKSSADTVKKLSLFSLLGFSIVACQIFCEVCKQLSNYSLSYVNKGKYPIPNTLMVIIGETLKLLATVIRAKGDIPSLSTESFRKSVKFLLPGILYAVNNNIYLAGLLLVPPPIWLILCSFRTVVTASTYKFVLKRQLSALQFLGALLIVISIIVAKVPDLLKSDSPHQVNAVPLMALVLAAIASVNSVTAAVYTETLFKGGSAKGERFLDQQFWLYLYGALVGCIVHFLTNTTYGFEHFASDIRAQTSFSLFLLNLALFFGSIGGLVVAAILKQLDNIVKEYSGSVANILTAVLCSFLFPDKFEFTIFIVLSMGCLLAGIYLYETQKVVTKVVAMEPKEAKTTATR